MFETGTASRSYDIKYIFNVEEGEVEESELPGREDTEHGGVGNEAGKSPCGAEENLQ